MAESIKKFIIKDAHGGTKESGSFSVVGEVHVNLVPGYGEPYAQSEYVNGILTITIHNIEGNGITDITTNSQEGDEAVNTVTIKTNANPEGVTLEVRNGSRGNGIASSSEVLSPEDGGTNTHTITDTDGNEHVFHTNNGHKGDKGDQGDSAVYDPSSPDAPVFAMANTTGQSTTKAMTQKAVSDIVVDNRPSFSENGSFINSSGNAQSASGYSRTKFIPVSSGQTIWYKGKIGSTNICVAGYRAASFSDFEQSLLAAGTYTTLTAITIPSGITHIAACTTNSQPTELVISYGLTSRVEKIENSVSSVNADLSTLATKVGEENKGSFPNTNSYIKEDGSDASANGYVRSDYIKVTPGQKVYYKGKIGSTYACIVGYSGTSGSSSFVGAVLSGDTYSTLEEVTIPAGVSYIRAQSDSRVTYALYTGFGLIKRIEDLESALDNADNNKLLKNEYYGKTVNWIGDSIVQDDDFDERVAAYFGMTLRDYGINGSTIASDTDNTRNAISRRYSNMSDDADVIVVSAGTNDWQYAHTLVGTMADRTDSTFYGALHVLCKGLIEKYPTKIVFFTTPIKRNQQNASTAYPLDTENNPVRSEHTLLEYADIIKEVCAYYSIPVCDLWGESYLNPNMTAQASMFDTVGTHPQGTAKDIMARRVRGFMKQLV